MIKRFKEVYYLQKLYSDAGRTINDYLYIQHVNLAHRNKLKNLRDKLAESEKSVYCFNDNIGRVFSLLCYMAAEKALSRGDVFVYIDDYFNTDKAMAVYLESGKKFIYSNEKGKSMKEYYYRTDSTKQTTNHYVKLAKSHFEKSEYIAKQRCL